MRVDLNNIHVLILALRDLLTRDHVTNINDAVLVTLIRIVVEEDMLRVVVGLVDEKELRTAV